jgi:hypothetical protein
VSNVLGTAGPAAEDTPATPLESIARGLIAGTAGTAAMDALLFSRYRRGGGTEAPPDWETSAGVTDWDKAPAPALVGKRLIEGLFGVQLPPDRARLVNNVTHWGFGIVSGAGYGVIAASLRRPRVLYGLLFGASVWSGGYVVLPLAKLYKPIWDYDAKTLADDLTVHLLYGLTTSATFALLSRRGRGRGEERGCRTR